MKQLVFFLLWPCFFSGQPALDGVEKLIGKKEFAKAEEVLGQYLAEHPNDLKAEELLGDVFAHQKKWDEAIEQYRKLANENPNNAQYHYKSGGAMSMKATATNKLKALSMVGDIKEAFKKTIALDPGHIDARWALVKLYMQLPTLVGGSVKTALKYADELEAISPVDGHLAKGYIYENSQKAELAEQHYKNAVLIGGSKTCFETLAKFYEKQNQPLKAMATLFDAERSLKLNTFNYEIGKTAAVFGVELNKGEQALALYLKNFKDMDGVPKSWAHYRMAQIYRQRNNRDKAEECIQMALGTEPQNKVFQEEQALINRL